jgi:LEA14-like dessication related protein
MKNKAILIGIIGAVGIAAFLVYRQFRKLMDYKLSFRSVKVKKINMQSIDLTLGLNFENKSDIQVVLASQQYDVFINNVKLTTLKNDKDVLISPKSVSPITFDVSVGSKGIADLIKTTSFSELLNIKKQSLRVDSTLVVKIGSGTRTIKQSSEDLIDNWGKK